MALTQIIEHDYIVAFKGGGKLVTAVLRGLKTAIKNAEIEKRGRIQGGGELSDDEVIAVVKRQVKQLEEAKEMFAQGGRNDLVEQNEEEITVLKKYLPQQLSEAQVREAVQSAVAGMGEVGAGDFGKVMGAAMKELKGKADGGVVGKMVKEALGM